MKDEEIGNTIVPTLSPNIKTHAFKLTFYLFKR